MVTESSITYLQKSIALARKLEDEIRFKADKRKSTFAGFGFLIRNRRLAEAILKLGTQHAYEGKMLLRSMIEIYTNYSWIELESKEHRANRFLKFAPIEGLKILKELSSFFGPTTYKSYFKKIIEERAKTRHLFICRNKNNKLKWATDWAEITSLENRMQKIMEAGAGKYDSFLYAIYRWSSSAIHGGPRSLFEVMENNRSLHAKAQPENDPLAQICVAAYILLATIEALANDAQVLDIINKELVELQSCVVISSKNVVI